MKRQFNPLILAAGFACLSCGDFTLKTPADETGPGEIRVIADVGTVARAEADNGIYKSFEPGDEISVFAWTGAPTEGGLTAGQTVVNNVINRYEGESVWVPENKMFWAESADGTSPEHSFAAVYPSVPLVMPGGLSGDYTALNGLVEDVLVARVDGQLPTNEPVRLTFDHVMAALEVRLTIGNEVPDFAPESVYVTVEAASGAVVDYVSASSKASGPAAEFRLASAADGLNHNAVLPEQTLPLNLVVHIGDISRTLKRDGLDLVLESGKRTIINLSVGRDVVEIKDISAKPWIDGGSDLVGTE